MSSPPSKPQLMPGEPAGPYILKNHLLIEAIVAHLPELADIIALSQTCRVVYHHVRSIWPRTATALSFANLRSTTNADAIAIVRRYLVGAVGSPLQSRLLDDGRVVRIGGGPPGSRYTDVWRHLRELDLSGTSVTTATVKVFIAASAGGKIGALKVDRFGVHGPFVKEFEGITTAKTRDAAYLRLLRDQGLRLERICVQNCPGVSIIELNAFLRKIIYNVSLEKRKEVKAAAIAAVNANLAANNNPWPGPGAGAAAPFAHQLPVAAQVAQHQQWEAMHPWGLEQGDEVSTIVTPLASTVDELPDYGLDCLSLRRLEVANVTGLYVSPSAKYRGKKEWEYRNDFPFARSVAHLNALTGILGIDVDVMFCQGATCAGGLEDERFRNFVPTPSLDGHSKTSYKDPLPRLPGERVLVNDDGRVFRIPKHCAVDASTLVWSGPGVHNPPPPGAWPGLQPANPPQPPPQPPPGVWQNVYQLHGVGGPANVNGPNLLGPGLQHPWNALGGPGGQANLPLFGPAQQAMNNTFANPAVLGPGPPHAPLNQPINPANPPHHPAAAAAVAGPATATATAAAANANANGANDPGVAHLTDPDGVDLLDDSDLDQAAGTAAGNASNGNNGGATATAAAAAGHGMYGRAYRRSMNSGTEDGMEGMRGAASGVREIAMMDGPRGLCEGCGREVWLCERCNMFWVVCCGGCAGLMGAGN